MSDRPVDVCAVRARRLDWVSGVPDVLAAMVAGGNGGVATFDLRIQPPTLQLHIAREFYRSLTAIMGLDKAPGTLRLGNYVLAAS